MNNYISVAPLYGEALSHSGIKGQKWGVMHGPPYPLARGKGGRLPKIKKIIAARQSKEEQANKKALKAEEKKEALKKNIIEHPGKLYKYKDMFSREELEELINAINFDQRLKDVKRNNFKKTVDTVKDAATLAVSIKNIATSAVDTYKAAQNISDILQKKGAFADKKESSTGSDDGKPESKQESAASSDSKKSESKKDTPRDSDSKPTPETKKGDSTKYETSSPEKRNSGIDTSLGSMFNNDSLITSLKPTTEAAYRRKKFVERGEAFLERLGSATPSTYYTSSQSSQSDRRRNRLDNYYSPSSYRS